MADTTSNNLQLTFERQMGAAQLLLRLICRVLEWLVTLVNANLELTNT